MGHIHSENSEADLADRKQEISGLHKLGPLGYT